MINTLNKFLSAARSYTNFDFAIFKLALIGTGVLLGTYFSEFFTQYLPAIWVLTVLCCAAIVFITIRKAFGNKGNRH